MLFEPGIQWRGEVRCTTCGALIHPGNRFCTTCGTPVAAAATVRPEGDYPVRVTALHPEKLSRLSTFFRIILFLPLIFMLLVLGTAGGVLAFGLILTGGIISGLIFIYWLSLLIRGRPVRWMFDVLVAIQRFAFRIYAYILLMADRYPPYEGDWQVSYEVDRPDRIQRRQLFIWKTIVSIPQFIVLGLFSAIVGAFVFVAWFIILLTGRFPKGMYDFVAGWIRWSARVNAYWMSLTDVFPAYGFSEQHARGGTTAYVLSAVIGGLIFFGSIGGIAALIAAPADTTEVRVSYSELENGEPSEIAQQAGIVVSLTEVNDPYDAEQLLLPDPGKRFVLVHIDLFNLNRGDVTVSEGDFRLKDAEGDNHRPVIVTVNGLVSPVRFREAEFVDAHAVFEIPPGDPLELTYTPSSSFIGKERVRFVFR